MPVSNSMERTFNMYDRLYDKNISTGLSSNSTTLYTFLFPRAGNFMNIVPVLVSSRNGPVVVHIQIRFE